MKKQVKNVPPPWMAGQKDINGFPMLIVHMSNGELEGLDNLQGGPSIDPNTGIREYSQLASIIENPEIQKLFHTVFSQIQEHGQVSPEIHEAYEVARHHSLPYREAPEEEKGPIHQLEKTGRKGDTKLAYVPENLIALLIELGHHISENPKTGLLEFWALNKLWRSPGKVFGEILRVVGTIGGAFFGGPIGAGLGNAAARAVTGSSIPNALVGGLKSGALAYGAQGLGQAAGLTAATPYSGGFFGGAPNMIASGLGSMGIGYAPANAAKAASAAGVPIAAAANAAPAAAQAAQSAAPSFMDNLAKIAPFAALGLSHVSDKQTHKYMKQHADEERARYDRERDQLGYSPNWKPVMSKRYVENPEFYKVSKEDRKHGIFPSPFVEAPRLEYAKGGSVKCYNKLTLVKGPGKGQDDLIKTSVPDGSWINDASSTSMFGDGSSEAGAQVLKKLERDIMSKAPKRLVKSVENHVSKTSKPVPVWLSKDEVPMPPTTVTVLGGGSNAKGAALLRNMTNNLRKHKTSNGSQLPPKAKNPFDYMKQRRA